MQRPPIRRRHKRRGWTVALSLLIALVLFACILRNERPATAPTTRDPRVGGSEKRHPTARETSPPRDKRPRTTASPDAVPLDRIAASPNVLLGIPRDADRSDDLLMDEGTYVLSYSARLNEPNWVSWNLNRSYLGQLPRRNDFRANPSLPVDFYHVTPRDYVHSGYDRGHLCPSADRDSDSEENSLTFLMTNMQPQLHELNAGPWEKLEMHERELARREFAELYIVAGGIFDENFRTIGHQVAVPNKLFKIIATLREGERAEDVTLRTPLIAVIMPNESWVEPRPWSEFVTSVDEIERQTGYDFLANVPEGVQRMIESRPQFGP